MKSHLETLLKYHRWADGRFLDACRGLTPEDYAAPFDGGWSSIRSILVHVAGAADIWTRRLQGEGPAHRPTEDDLPTLDDVSALIDETSRRLDAILAACDDARLRSPWTYHALDGQPRTVPLWSVFHHVVNHGTYHRGQLANRLARRGLGVPMTDLVLWAAEPVPGSP